MNEKMLDFNVKGIALDEESQLPVVILEDVHRSEVFPLFIGPFEASAIIIEIEGVHPPRPLTHDLFSEIFRRHHFQLVSVEIYGRLEDKYLARINYKTRLSSHTMEVRPSDGIALALRLGGRILVKESLLEKCDRAGYDDNTAPFSESQVLYLESQKPGIQLM